MTDSINWRYAIFGGACLGGVMWATVARVAVFSSAPSVALGVKWAIASVCVGLIAVGLVVARWARTSALRTAGAAVVIAPLTGGSLILIIGGLRMALT
ncbi:hypothetical protein [Mycobacterium sp.]|uniref:hypothetical protein n=1 Tax=Mycobacterium sp. TaxID=1785 RepID=UPI003D6C07E2